MTSANDYSRLGVVHQDETHDYKKIMEYCSDPNNWFKRARGEWDDRCPRCGRPDSGVIE